MLVYVLIYALCGKISHTIAYTDKDAALEEYNDSVNSQNSKEDIVLYKCDTKQRGPLGLPLDGEIIAESYGEG